MARYSSHCADFFTIRCPLANGAIAKINITKIRTICISKKITTEKMTNVNRNITQRSACIQQDQTVKLCSSCTLIRRIRSTIFSCVNMQTYFLKAQLCFKGVADIFPSEAALFPVVYSPSETGVFFL